MFNDGHMSSNRLRRDADTPGDGDLALPPAGRSYPSRRPVPPTYDHGVPPAVPAVLAGLRVVDATRYAAPLREGGSLPGLVEADDDGMYVVKFRGAGQGVKALVAEVVAGELGRALGLPVPELVLVEVAPGLGRAEPDQEIHDLVAASIGTNLGMDYLPGSMTFSPPADGAGARRPDPALAADIVWFDGLVTNVDRSPHNPNLLTWHGRVHLIDHGAALYVHHSWRDPSAHARRPFPQLRDHVLMPYAGPLTEADQRLSALIDESLLRAVLSVVPESWLVDDTFAGPAQHRQAYVDYLMRRLEPPRPFLAGLT